MECKIVFCDVDGTLLNSNHKVLPGTVRAVRELQRKKIPFVITSGRSPSGIYPILKETKLNCPIIAYSGGLIMDENRNVLFSIGISKTVSAKVISYIEDNSLDCTWNIYSMDTWIVKDKSDPRVIEEEKIIQANTIEGTLSTLEEGAEVNKILCMCNPDATLQIEQLLKFEFPDLSIAKSSDTLLEIMQKGVTKSSAVTRICDLWQIPIESTVAFGDHYNDLEMLETVALPFLMGNAPEELKGRFQNITLDNDHEGIYQALVQTGVI